MKGEHSGDTYEGVCAAGEWGRSKQRCDSNDSLASAWPHEEVTPKILSSLEAQKWGICAQELSMLPAANSRDFWPLILGQASLTGPSGQGGRYPKLNVLLDILDILQ